MNPAAIAEIIQLALPLAQGALRAIEAANNGDLTAARSYLAEARGRFDEASAELDAALAARATLGKAPPG